MDKTPSISLEEQNEDKAEESKFDVELGRKWREAQSKGVFRYVLNIEEWKILDGKYGFLAQLNTNRGEKRRLPEPIVSMDQPFNPGRFNFTKLPEEEILVRLNEEDILAVNVSPLEDRHCLLLVQRQANLPQVLTLHSLRVALRIFDLSHSPYVRLAFNSLCAHASVNHLHWHLYYLKHKMLLEHIDLKDFEGPVEVLEDYPARGFCVRLSRTKDPEDFASWVFLVARHLQERSVAHNVYLTRSKEEDREDLRAYVWARESCATVKDTRTLVIAVCELFGHLCVRSRKEYEELTEEKIEGDLKATVDRCFVSTLEDLRLEIRNRRSDH